MIENSTPRKDSSVLISLKKVQLNSTFYCQPFRENSSNLLNKVCVYVLFYDISTLMSYLMPNPVMCVCVRDL